MNFQIALGALVIMLALSAGTLLARWYLRPTGTHRAPRHAAHGAIAPTAFVHCLHCGVETAATLHPGGSASCTEGHLIPAGGA